MKFVFHRTRTVTNMALVEGDRHTQEYMHYIEAQLESPASDKDSLKATVKNLLFLGSLKQKDARSLLKRIRGMGNPNREDD